MKKTSKSNKTPKITMRELPPIEDLPTINSMISNASSTNTNSDQSLEDLKNSLNCSTTASNNSTYNVNSITTTNTLRYFFTNCNIKL